MRTSIITAVGHDGKGVLISGKETGLLKNQEIFKDFKRIAVTEGAHEKFAEVSHQENDNHEELLRFRTPDAQKKHAEARAEEKKAHAEAVAEQEKRESAPRTETAPVAEEKKEAEPKAKTKK